MSAQTPAIFADWPGGVKAMLAVDAACDTQGLSLRLLELVRLFCSVLNDCGFCIDMHKAKAAALGVPVATLDALTENRDAAALNDAERAATNYALALTVLGDDAAIAEAASALHAHFDRQQISVLTTTIAQINAWNRMLRADKALSPPVSPFPH
jgi:AhpD family alkylhydroperoxidase